MSISFERQRRKLFLVQNQPVPKAAATIRCVEQTDFPDTPAQVTGQDVDTAGKDAPLSSQEGI